eukprot:CAMPEP_0202469224 /NCGR_PEP_ID=MMETSP1360-20130828/77847_1 /ASSEMBLY_ACC=CAM_ASM_000848 /TAXON_ID=515479 /ORGANISM="Licmophora paradoxa, Strain CCMP2313" /LENGTH=232 /DNA_ID=CAMNT_0049094501 /DNA_START=143 /DNA_END=838 /DNA_ORIENTATION=+
MGHVLGVGTLWATKGLTPTNLPPSCNQYSGVNANREYNTITGCPRVPIETEGGGGTACGHFTEDCLQRELMTGFSDVVVPLSRVTIGTIEDLGYSVDYNAADPYDTEDIDPACVCDDGSRRFLGGSGRGRDRLLQNGGVEDGLSEEGHKACVDYGLSLISEYVSSFESNSQKPDSSPPNFYQNPYMTMTILYMENGRIYDVEVSSNDLQTTTTTSPPTQAPTSDQTDSLLDW